MEFVQIVKDTKNHENKGSRFKFNFQTTSKTKLCDSNTKTKKLKTRTQDVQNKHENISLLCSHM